MHLVLKRISEFWNIFSKIHIKSQKYFLYLFRIHVQNYNSKNSEKIIVSSNPEVNNEEAINEKAFFKNTIKVLTMFFLFLFLFSFSKIKFC